MNQKERLGARISQLRKKAGIRQQDLADKAGIKQEHLSRIENGRHMPRFDIVVKIADALGVSVETLVV